jgi:hypothetical protein
MIGHDRTARGAMQALMGLLAARGLTSAWIAARIDSLTHTNVPPAFRRAPMPEQLTALDQAVAAAADYERRIEQPDLGYMID